MKNEIQTLNVRRMTCAACVRSVERAVDKQPGITKASVNLTTEKLQVSFDPDQVTLEHIIQAVSKAGFTAEAPSGRADAEDTETRRQVEELRDQRLRLRCF